MLLLYVISLAYNPTIMAYLAH